MTRYKMHKYCRECLRWCPIVGTLIVCLHCLSLLLGYASPFVAFICDSSIMSFVLMLLASYVCEFCVWHRLCIIYTYIVSVCVDYHKSVGFGEYVQSMRLIVFIIGCMLIVTFIGKKRYKPITCRTNQ